MPGKLTDTAILGAKPKENVYKADGWRWPLSGQKKF